MRNDYIGNHPLLCLALSLIPLSLSLYGILTGTAVFRSSRWSHDEEPLRFLVHNSIRVWTLRVAV